MLRRRLEGLAFLAAALMLAPLVVVALLWRTITGIDGCAEAIGYILRRWVRFIVHGLRDIRNAWWVALSYEPAFVVWRYLIMLEVFSILNLAGTRGGTSAREEHQKIGVIKLGHVGDALHVIPMLRALRRQAATSQIDLLVGPWSKALAKRITYVSNVIEYAPWFVMFHRGMRSGRLSWLGEVAFLMSLRTARYDLLISTSSTTLIELVLLVATWPKRWVGTTIPADLYHIPSQGEVQPYDTKLYEAERVMELLRPAGFNIENAHLEYPLADEVAIDDLYDAQEGHILVVVSPGAGWADKAWAVERFAELADHLVVEYHGQILLVGSAGEEELCSELQNAMHHEAQSLAGKTNLDELASMIRRCDLFIGNDSAPMHLAAVYDRPSVLLFGPTMSSKWAPSGDHVEVLQRGGLCEGCWGWHPSARCVHNNRCMKGISVDDAKAAVERIMPEVRKRSMVAE